MCRSSLSLVTLSSAGLISTDASGATLFLAVLGAQASANVTQANNTPRKRLCFFIFVPFGYLFPGCGQTSRNRKSARKERWKYGGLLMICRVLRQTFRPAKIFPTALVTGHYLNRERSITSLIAFSPASFGCR